MPLLFAYGTLRREDVQMSTFGRLLTGEPDELVGFEQVPVEIDALHIVATSGTTRHTIVRFNGRDDSRVRGTVLELSDSELEMADRYEPAAYTRVSARLASGREAWVYATPSALPLAAVRSSYGTTRHAERAGPPESG